jgi:hypothetical protein
MSDALGGAGWPVGWAHVVFLLVFVFGFLRLYFFLCPNFVGVGAFNLGHVYFRSFISLFSIPYFFVIPFFLFLLLSFCCHHPTLTHPSFFDIIRP